jgi:hypothetical protein
MSLIIGDYAASFLGLSEAKFWHINAFEVGFVLTFSFTISLIRLCFIKGYQDS